MPKTIVILGGAYAGVQVAHRLLKHTRSSVPDLKVILVSKNSHFYWNMASVRAIVPGVLEESQYSQPLADGFAKYPTEAFELIVGSAQAVDVDARTVRIAAAATTETNNNKEQQQQQPSPRVLSYDHLVLATGTRDVDPAMPWKGSGTHEEVGAAVSRVRDRVAAASHIVVAGAGATGVEVAAELRYEFKDAKTVVLLSAGPEILGGDSVAASASAELGKLGVEVRTRARVVSSSVLPDGRTEVVLEGGGEDSKITTDLYLPTMGVVPNTDYLPEGLLTDKGFVDVDEFFAVTNAKNVWAAGDIVWKPRGSFVLADMQAAGVAKNIDLVLKGKSPVVVKTLPFDPFLCATGRSRGVGRLGVVKIFSVMVYYIKGKTLGVERLRGWVDGSSF